MKSKIDVRHAKQPPMKLTSYRGASILQGKNLKTYDLGDEDVREALNSQRQNFFTTVQTAPKSPTKPIVHFDNRVIKNDAALATTMCTGATADSINAQTWRNTTKHRSVTSTARCFGNGFGQDVKQPFDITVTTGCVANFMRDKEGDIPFYTDPSRQFLVEDTTRAKKHDSRGREIQIYKLTDNGKKFYTQQLKLQFKRWLSIQNDQGVNVVIFPMVGGGVYLTQLTHSSQTEARDEIHNALKEAIQEFNADCISKGKQRNIQEVIYALPANNKTSHDYNQAIVACADYGSGATNPLPALTITNGDVFEIADAVANHPTHPPLKVGFINPGSDRTIGGAYLSTTTPAKPKDDKIPLEETICHLTNTVFQQAIDFNNDDINQYTKQPYDQNLMLQEPIELQALTNIVPAAQQNQNSATNPNAASLQTPNNINLLSTWAIRAMQQRTTEWQALNLNVGNGVITGHSAKGSTISITKDAINFSFKNINEEKDTIRQSLRLLIAATKNPNSTTTTRLPISFTGSEEVQVVLKSICREPEFLRFFDIDGTQPQHNPASASTTQPTPASSTKPENAGEPLDDDAAESLVNNTK